MRTGRGGILPIDCAPHKPRRFRDDIRRGRAMADLEPPRGAMGATSFWGVTGALLAALAVLAGAFGAHSLKGSLTPVALAAFETAVRYQFFHALALLVIAGLLERPRHGAVAGAAWTLLLGILFFSGSLYLLTLTPMRWPGPFTPVGGLFFLIGWLSLAWGLWPRRAARNQAMNETR
jgi:uncharacterized membrane protein YgdD (TMEM256/DUF423 family)